MQTRVNINIHIPVSNTDELRKALNVLGTFDLLVGVPADDQQKNNQTGGKTNRTTDKGKPAKANNALIAYVMNNGSPSRNIPARPTLLPGIADATDKITQRFEDAGKLALDGNTIGIEKNLAAAGQAAVDAVKLRVRSNTPPPLSPKTIAARRRRGFQSDNTLVETGQYLNSHSFTVQRKKG